MPAGLNHINLFFVDKHPLAEVSLRLDAPATLEKLPEAKILEVTEEMYSSPRSHIKGKIILTTQSGSRAEHFV